MKTVRRDLILYLCFNIINCILVCALFLFFDSEIDRFPEKIKIIISFCLGHIAIVLLLLFIIYVGMNFHFEAFTYMFLIVSIIIIIASIKTIKTNCIQMSIGLSLLNIGIFARFILWKYDIKKLNEKGNT